jgi:SAM-dependent methyltransferase
MRGYQRDFYTLNDGVRDPNVRRHKADKIGWALARYYPGSLDTASCLDVGCSSGLMTALWTPLFRHSFGLDYDAIALAAIPAPLQSTIGFLRGDAMGLPLPDASVDVVVCAQVYEHVPDDVRLFAEIWRVLRPGGIVFFSGPNWLFPIEPHYFLPFLHWMPRGMADRYLQRTGCGEHYYERSRSWWGLRRLLAPYAIADLTAELVQAGLLVQQPLLQRLLAQLPDWGWKLLVPLLPNFNWILRKPPTGAKAP